MVFLLAGDGIYQSKWRQMADGLPNVRFLPMQEKTDYFDLLRASNIWLPIVLDAESPAGRAYNDAVGRFLGETIEHRFLKPERRGFFQRLIGRAA